MLGGEGAAFSVANPEHLRVKIAERVAALSSGKLMVRGGRLVPRADSPRAKAPILREVGERYGLSYSELHKLAHKKRERMTGRTIAKVGALVGPEVALSFIYSPAMLLWRLDYTTRQRKLLAWLPTCPEKSPEVPLELLNRVRRSFRQRVAHLGPPDGRLQLADARVTTQMAGLPTATGHVVKKSQLESLLRRLYRAEAALMEVERLAYGAMYGSAVA